ncbi:MAG: hypothetical protein AAGD43_22325 [Pseudomonadota bacterium]
MDHIEQKPISIKVVIICATLLLGLGIATLANMMAGRQSQNREFFNPKPQVSLSLEKLRALPGQVRRYLKKTFYGRELMRGLYSATTGTLFGHLPTSEVIMGTDGYYFIWDASAKVTALDYPPPTASLLREWDQVFSTLEKTVSGQKTKFIFVLAPNKHTMMREKLPEHLRAINAESVHAKLILASARSKLSSVSVDFISTLEKRCAKTTGAGLSDLYLRTDTHWTTLAASCAARTALLENGIKVPEFRSRSFKAERGGDLSRLIGRQSWLPDVSFVIETPHKARCRQLDGRPVDLNLLSLDTPLTTGVKCESDDTKLGKLVVFMDSFGMQTVPYLGGIFKESLFLWRDKIDLEFIEKEKPQVVIQVFAERKAAYFKPSESLEYGYAAETD